MSLTAGHSHLLEKLKQSQAASSVKLFDRDFLVHEFWERHARILEKVEISSPRKVLISLPDRGNC